MSLNGKIYLLSAIIGISLIGVFFLGPINQDPAYHNFADIRSIFGIPNFFNFISNIPFLLVGVYGALYTTNYRQKKAPVSWITLFIGVALVCFGSGYYHLNPAYDPLVWDRLPITIGFMGLVTGILSESINPKIERYLLLPAVLLGVLSVMVWEFTNDLRLYLWVQAISILIIPLVLLLFKGGYTHRAYYFYAFLLYIIAKLFEALDREVYDITGNLISGHTLKHLFAAGAIYSLYLMLRRREPRGG